MEKGPTASGLQEEPNLGNVFQSVTPGSKGQKAGFLVGDVVTNINDVDVLLESHDGAKGLISRATNLVVKVERPLGEEKKPIQRHEPPPKVTEEPLSKVVIEPPSKVAAEPPPKVAVEPPHKETVEPYIEHVLKPEPAKTRIPSAAPPYPKINSLSSSETPESTGHLLSKSGQEKKCEKCGDDIKPGKFLQYDGKFWHTGHFLCHECKDDISATQFYEKDGKLCCQKCYKKDFCKKCENCGDYCIDKSVVVEDKCYHELCFQCKKCSKSLLGVKFRKQDDGLYCIECLSDIMGLKCHACSKRIEVNQNYLEMDNDKYHAECLKCNICQASLAGMGSIVIIDNKPCCPNH
ncbi:PDZ and LIM domain protein 7 [Thelohanellus kitauei]|uniref:PDZ and LIM domain protein 7 n=1 Tax=Thelohanellus kitauei TaxID=669202 RepID=A0A0C2ML12_THEKT|nr:PDZ and LIM domain protein 7 [Thelohanellus kitauei]